MNSGYGMRDVRTRCRAAQMRGVTIGTETGVRNGDAARDSIDARMR